MAGSGSSRLPWRTYADFLKEWLPQHRKVRKVMLDAGFTCPNLDGTVATGGCSFCNNTSFSPAQRILPPLEQLSDGVERVRRKYPDAGILAYFQAHTNTHAPVSDLREVFTPVLLSPLVDALSIGTRPDCMPEEVCDLLAELSERKPVLVELGLQTANDVTLQKINRMHTAESYALAVDRLAQRGIPVSCHLILGLPGEDEQDWIATAHFVANHALPVAVKIHPLHVVKGTRMAMEWRTGQLELLTAERYAAGVAKVISILPDPIAVERITGDALGETGLAPEWSGNRILLERLVTEEICALSRDNGQG